MRKRTLKKTIDTKSEIFTAAEISRLWEAKDTNVYYGVILMYIYTGCRTSELLNLKKTEVDLPGRCFRILEAKTTSGIRTVPIAEKLVPLFEYWLNLNDCEYLLSTPDGCQLEYSKFLARWSSLMKSLSMNHLSHHSRHTCKSLLAAAGVAERITSSITGRPCLYSANMSEMLDAINKI